MGITPTGFNENDFTVTHEPFPSGTDQGNCEGATVEYSPRMKKWFCTGCGVFISFTPNIIEYLKDFITPEV